MPDKNNNNNKNIKKLRKIQFFGEIWLKEKMLLSGVFEKSNMFLLFYFSEEW